MKKGILTLIGVLFIVLQFNFASASELTDDYFDIASNYFCSNNYAKSLEYVNDILNVEPDNQKALELKTKLLPFCAKNETIETNETAKILNNIQKPENITILNVPQADIEKMNYDSDYYNQKGQGFYEKKEYDTSIEYFYKSVKLNNKNAQAYNNLGMAYWLKNNPNLAMKYFKKASSINKTYSQPLVNMALLYKKLGEDKKHFYSLQKAIKYNPNCYWAYYLLGEYYRENSDFKCAIKNYKEAVKINNKFAQAYLGLAISFFDTEEFNYAAIAIAEYQELCPNSDYAYLLTARIKLVQMQFADAKTNIEKAIALKDKLEYQFELARIDYYLEDYQGALDILQTVLQKTCNAEYFNYAGLCCYKLKNIDAAIANFNKAINIDGLRPIYYYNLAQCYKSLGDKVNYVKYVNTATKITPINYQDFIDLSYIYYDNGNPNFAINTLEDATRKYPTVKALYLSKLKIYESIGDSFHYSATKDSINERFNTK